MDVDESDIPGMHIVFSISSKAETESLESFRSNIRFYKDRNFSYIPLPAEDKYYNIETESLGNIKDEQYLGEDDHLFNGLKLLLEHNFLLVDLKAGYRFTFSDGEKYSYSEVEQMSMEEIYEGAEFPDIISDMMDQPRYHIITLADANKRSVNEMIYPVLAELEEQFSTVIEECYPDSTSLFNQARPRTIGRWQKAKSRGVEVHIAEYMTLGEMKTLIEKEEDLRDKCGFSSRNQFKKKMSGVVNLRNKVMHANRTLIHDKNDLEQLLDRFKRALAVSKSL